MKYAITILLITSLLASTSYAGSDRTPLAEQLKGKSASEKQETLRLACLNGAEKITGRTSMWKRSGHSDVLVHDAKVEKMKNLCREMSQAYLTPNDNLQNLSPAAGGNMKTSARMAELNKECLAQLHAADNGRNSQAIQNIQQVCDAYTGSTSIK